MKSLLNLGLRSSKLEKDSSEKSLKRDSGFLSARQSNLNEEKTAKDDQSGVVGLLTERRKSYLRNE